MKPLFLAICLITAVQFATPAEAAHKLRSASMGSSSTFSISPGLKFLGNLVGPSINSYVGFAPMEGHELYVGADLGVALFFPGGFLMNISILPAAWYQFKIPKHETIRLVAGLAFGPSILAGAGGGISVSGVTYEVLFRPGFLMETSDNSLIGGDLKFGTIGGVFTFRPQVNWIYAF